MNRINEFPGRMALGGLLTWEMGPTGRAASPVRKLAGGAWAQELIGV